jgi:hypothetical protein
MAWKDTSAMTDLEFCIHYVEDGRSGFIDPFLFNTCRQRGLVPFIDRLTGSQEERKAEMYARFAKAGKVFGDPEIDQIAGVVARQETLRRDLDALQMTNWRETLEITRQMTENAEFIRDYFKT